MNLLTFGAGIGLPAPFKVVYDGAKKAFISEPTEAEEGIFNRPLCRKAVSSDLRLKVYFSSEDGTLCGFEYCCGDIENLPQAEIDIPYAPDGFVKLVKCFSSHSDGVSFVVFPKLPAVYDGKSKTVAVGSINDGDCFYRVCENMCVGVGESGAPTFFLIKI